MMEQPESDSEDKTDTERPLRTQIVNLIFLIQHLIASDSQSQDKSVQEYLNNLNNQFETLLRNFYPQEEFFGEMLDRIMWKNLMDNGALRYYAEYEKKLTGLSKRMVSVKQQFQFLCDTTLYDPATGQGSWAELKQAWEKFRTHTATDRKGIQHKISNVNDFPNDMFRKYKWNYMRDKSKELQENLDTQAKELQKQFKSQKFQKKFNALAKKYPTEKTTIKNLEKNSIDNLKSKLSYALQIFVYRELNPLYLKLKDIFFKDNFLGTFDELKTKLSSNSNKISDDDLKSLLSEMKSRQEIDEAKRQNPDSDKLETVYHKHESKKNKPSKLNPTE